MARAPLTRLLLTMASVVVVLAGMRAATPVIGPVAIALLITIAWSPASQWLQRRGWPPLWSPDGSLIVLQVADGENDQIGVVRVSDRARYSPVRQPTTVAIHGPAMKTASRSFPAVMDSGDLNDEAT